MTKQRRGRPPKEERIPLDGDKAWVGISEPLFTFLGTPRNWEALETWGRSQQWNGNRLRNCLAWLDNHGLAYSWWDQKGAVIWARTGWAESGQPSEPDPLDEAVSIDDLDL